MEFSSKSQSWSPKLKLHRLKYKARAPRPETVDFQRKTCVCSEILIALICVARGHIDFLKEIQNSYAGNIDVLENSSVLNNNVKTTCHF